MGLPLVPKKSLIEKIGDRYATAAARIVSTLRGLDPATYTARVGAAAMRRIRDIVDGLDASVAGWAKTAVRAAYAEAKAGAEKRLAVLRSTRLM